MADGDNENSLFPTSDLIRLLNADGTKYDLITASLLPRGLVLRPLRISDYSKGYMGLLSQHTVAGDVSQVKFEAQFAKMKSYGDIYYVVVVEDLNQGKIVATGTLEVEHKFIHSAAIRGRLEDVVVDKEDAKYRYTDGNLAVVVLDVLTTLGKVVGCYKISLESEDHLLAFYNKFGYQHIEGQKYMVMRYRA